jgi:glycerate kinase
MSSTVIPIDPTAPESVHWVDSQLRVAGVPGTFRRHGRYLYLRADRTDGVIADGHVVDGLQLVRTDDRNPTRLESHGVTLRGVQSLGSVGVQRVALGA